MLTSFFPRNLTPWLPSNQKSRTRIEWPNGNPQCPSLSSVESFPTNSDPPGASKFLGDIEISQTIGIYIYKNRMVQPIQKYLETSPMYWVTIIIIVQWEKQTFANSRHSVCCVRFHFSVCTSHSLSLTCWYMVNSSSIHQSSIAKKHRSVALSYFFLAQILSRPWPLWDCSVIGGSKEKVCKMVRLWVFFTCRKLHALLPAFRRNSKQHICWAFEVWSAIGTCLALNSTNTI